MTNKNSFQFDVDFSKNNVCLSFYRMQNYIHRDFSYNVDFLGFNKAQLHEKYIKKNFANTGDSTIVQNFGLTKKTVL